jgi:hypothetical protein
LNDDVTFDVADPFVRHRFKTRDTSRGSIGGAMFHLPHQSRQVSLNVRGIDGAHCTRMVTPLSFKVNPFILFVKLVK